MAQNQKLYRDSGTYGYIVVTYWLTTNNQSSSILNFFFFISRHASHEDHRSADLEKSTLHFVILVTKIPIKNVQSNRTVQQI